MAPGKNINPTSFVAPPDGLKRRMPPRRSKRTTASLTSAVLASPDARNAINDQVTKTAVAVSPTVIQMRLNHLRKVLRRSPAVAAFIEFGSSLIGAGREGPLSP